MVAKVSRLSPAKLMPMLSKRVGSIALACPGQGILPQGCLSPFKKHIGLFQSSLDCIDETAGQRFSKYLLDSSLQLDESWNRSTANAQLAILGTTCLISNLFRELSGIDLVEHNKVSYLLGHSLGEYSCLVLSKVISFEQGCKLVRRRGLLMEELFSKLPLKAEMHVLVFRPSEFNRVYEETLHANVLACVNNASQISISGKREDLLAVVQKLDTPKKTILKQAILPVDIPFHNRILRKIEKDLRLVLDKSSPSIKPIVCNIDAMPHVDDLLEQTISATSKPVQWKDSMDFLSSQAVDYVINLGPGNAVDAINSRFKIKNLPLKTEDDMTALLQIFNK